MPEGTERRPSRLADRSRGPGTSGRRHSAALGIAAGLLSLALAGCINVGPFAPPELERVVVEKSPRWIEWNRIALVDVSGFIESEPGLWSLLGATSVADVKQKLQIAAADGRVRAVVLRINSPGGEASASDMIYEEVRHFKEQSGKPVVAALMGTAASGGYYVALSADRIVANPTCITGSVGVIMDLLNVEGLYGKIGLRSEVIKSGDKKDIGSATRKLTDEERAILQGVNRALFDRFLEVVRAGRPKMDAAQRATVADGRIFTPQQALQLNMVDSIGYLSDAIALARDLAGITHADVVLYRPFPSYNSNIYAKSGADLLFEGGLELLLRRQGPAFLYLWSPGS